MQKIRQIAWDNQIKPAKPEEIKQITWYEIGAISPFWFEADVIKILDKDILNSDKIINIWSWVAEIWFEMMPTELQKAWDWIIEEISER